MKKIIFILVLLLASAGYAAPIGNLQIPLESPVPYQVVITVNLYSSPRTLLATEKVIQQKNKPYVNVNLAKYNIEETGLVAPYVELISHLIAGDNRIYLSDLGAVASTCSDGTAIGFCSQTKPQFCDSGALVNNCQQCGCPSGQTCLSTGGCMPVTCPNAICESAYGETCSTCLADCGPCPPPPAPAPTADIKANGQDSLVIPSGFTALLTWNSTNADTCTASGAWSGAKATDSAEWTAALTATSAFDITCTGPSGSAGDSVTITIAPTSCGTNGCEIGETCSSCPQDCGACPPLAGWKTLTCKTDWTYLRTDCSSNCYGDCEAKVLAGVYGSQYTDAMHQTGSSCRQSCFLFFCQDTAWDCHCYVKQATTVACSYDPSCPEGYGLVGSTDCAPTCSDGTVYYQCSVNKPKYCDSGTLVDKASVCGCPSGLVPVGNTCDIPRCIDNTPYNSCSSTKPKYCDNGTLVDKASVCGCPVDQTPIGEACGISPPSCSASFSPSNVISGQSSNMIWSSSADADNQIPYSCTGNLGSGTLSGASGSRSFSPGATQTCTLTVQSAVGSDTCAAGVAVNAPMPPPTCSSVAFTPSTITQGQSTSLGWSCSDDADNQIPYSCTGNLGSGTLSGASGSRSFTPGATQTCTLTVQNADGINSYSAQVTVNPLPAPSCSAMFSPNPIVVGQSTSMTWSSSNDADGQIPYSCTGNLGAGTLSGASGSRSFTPGATQTCTLTVQSAASSNTCSAAVTVNPPAATCSSVAFIPNTITTGQSTSLQWSCSGDTDGQIPYSCTGNLGSGTLTTLSGSQSFTPGATQTCTLTVQNAGGTNTYNAQVTVNAAVANLIASLSCGPSCSAVCGGPSFTPPEGATAYYYSTRVQETNGVGATLTGKCRYWAACGGFPETTDCLSISVTVPPSDNVIIPGAFFTFCQPRDFVETLSGIDTNGNTVSVITPFTVSGC